MDSEDALQYLKWEQAGDKHFDETELACVRQHAVAPSESLTLSISDFA